MFVGHLQTQTLPGYQEPHKNNILALVIPFIGVFPQKLKVTATQAIKIFLTFYCFYISFRAHSSPIIQSIQNMQCTYKKAALW
jgi:hypothetical protein